MKSILVEYKDGSFQWDQVPMLWFYPDGIKALENGAFGIPN